MQAIIKLMPLLRLRQTTEGDHRYRMLLELEDGGALYPYT